MPDEEIRSAPDGPIVVATDVTVAFGHGPHAVRPVEGADLTIQRGEFLGLVGESGSGKTLLVRSIAGLAPHAARITSTDLVVAGCDLAASDQRQIDASLGGRVSVIFQNPAQALNPTMRLGRQLAEPLRVHGAVGRREAREAARESLAAVKVDPSAVDKYPHELSGGMRQRVMIAMALIGDPELVLADEPTTALDVSVQQHTIAILSDLNHRAGTTVVLVSHDITLVADVCTRIAVMYAGRIVEEGPVDVLVAAPKHPYTQALIDSVPRMDSTVSEPLKTIEGSPPSAGDTTKGCSFAPRCPFVMDRCRSDAPPMIRIEPTEQAAACWLHDERAQVHDELGVVHVPR